MAFNKLKIIRILAIEKEVPGVDWSTVSKLPLVKKNLITFEVMELRPYTGYDRVIYPIE